MDAGAGRCAGQPAEGGADRHPAVARRGGREGIIKTDDKIKVVSSGDNIVIQPATPETIYVPQYEPRCFTWRTMPPQPISYYADPYPTTITRRAGFWAGAVTGAFFAAAVDWDDWGVWGGDWGGDIDYRLQQLLQQP